MKFVVMVSDNSKTNKVTFNTVVLYNSDRVVVSGKEIVTYQE